MQFLFSDAILENIRSRGIGGLSDVFITPIESQGVLYAMESNQDMVDLSVGNKVDMSLRAERLLESISCNGESILFVSQSLNLIPLGLIIAMDVFSVLIMLFCCCMIVWVLLNRNRKLIRNSSPPFLIQVAFGGALQASTVFVLQQQDDWLEQKAIPVLEFVSYGASSLDLSCRLGPVLFSIGFFMLFSALFLKAWRLIKIFNNTKLRHLYVKDKQLLAYQFCVMFTIVSLNLIWLLTDPLVWRRNISGINEKLNLVTESYGLCFSPGGVASATPFNCGDCFSVIRW